MWHLEKTSQNILDEYADLLIKGIKSRINDNQNTLEERNWGNYLLSSANGIDSDKFIREILTAEPSNLIRLNNTHITELLRLSPNAVRTLGPTYSLNDTDYKYYLTAKRRRKAGKRVGREKTVFDAFHPLFTYLYKIFDYNMVKDNEIGLHLAYIKKTNTCPYCNRAYTFVIGKKSKTGKNVSKIRPHFDHWFAHEQYPLLSISFYNLIPSCPTCNSSAKGATTFALNTHIHPYETASANPNFRFCPILKYDESEHRTRWSVLLKRTVGSMEDNTIKSFWLDEIYDKHGELEVKDIMDFAQGNNVTYLKGLFKTICEDFKGERSVGDVYRMLFGIEAEIDKILNRPFSKLKRDILEGEGIIIDINNP